MHGPRWCASKAKSGEGKSEVKFIYVFIFFKGHSRFFSIFVVDGGDYDGSGGDDYSGDGGGNDNGDGDGSECYFHP